MGDFDFPQGGETQKMGDSTFRRSTTGSFCCIFHFVGRRQTVFEAFLAFRGVGSVENRVFYQSESSERLFFMFSIHPRARKRGNSCFLLIRGLGKVVFHVFYPSEGSERLFFVFSIHPRARKCGKSRFLSIRGLGWVVFHSIEAMKKNAGNLFHKRRCMRMAS